MEKWKTFTFIRLFVWLCLDLGKHFSQSQDIFIPGSLLLCCSNFDLSYFYFHLLLCSTFPLSFPLRCSCRPLMFQVNSQYYINFPSSFVYLTLTHMCASLLSAPSLLSSEASFIHVCPLLLHPSSLFEVIRVVRAHVTTVSFYLHREKRREERIVLRPCRSIVISPPA